MHGTEINNLSLNLIIWQKIGGFQQNRGQIGGKLQLFGPKPPIREQTHKIGGNVASMGQTVEKSQGLSGKIPRLSGSPEGEVFQTTPRLFNSLSDFGFLEVQGQTCPRALYGKSSRKPQ